MKKYFYLLCCCLCINLPLLAGGNKETLEQNVSNLESWQETFDISNKKAGKYNIMVTATDGGGNTAVVGPYNMFIDPLSDLPIAGITNPLQDMRVPGNLNIVGTCIDDDSVGSVMIILDDDVENPIEADGTEFWSYYLDTTKLSEGRHKIEVYGVDINGVQGNSVFVYWHLDRKQPVTEVSNYTTGHLFAGKVRLQGTISDGNGIKRLHYSLDGGETFTELKIKNDKKTNVSTFDVPLNVTLLEDGPSVCWFKAEDLQGTVGVYSYLFYVDNTKPTVELVYPTLEETENGIVPIAVYAKDAIDIASISYQFEKEEPRFFEIVPGNPYWTAEYDTRSLGPKAKSFTVTLCATDTAGNITVVKKSIPINSELDKPVINLRSPIENQLVTDSLLINGIATDDDGIAVVKYQLDNQEFVEIKTDSVFSGQITASEEDFGYGKHILKIVAVDVTGVESDVISIPFQSLGPSPSVSNPRLERGKESSVPYSYGMEVHPEDGYVFKTSAQSLSGLKEARVTVGSNESLVITPKNPQKEINLSFPIDYSCPWGIVPIEVNAVDIFDRHVSTSYVVTVLNLTEYKAEPEVVFFDSFPKIDFRKESIVSGYFVGGKASSVRLEPETTHSSVSLSGNSIKIVPGSGIGTSEEITVIVTSDKGFEYKSEPLVFVNPSPAPILSMENEKVFSGFEKVVLSGAVSSEVPIAQLGYRLLTSSEDREKSLEKIEADDKGNFAIELESTLFSEGITIVEVLVTTKEGETDTKALFVSKTSPMPEPLPGKKPVTPAKPVVKWIEGEQVYYTAYYQGDYSQTQVKALLNNNEINGTFFPEGGAISKTLFTAGNNSMTVTLHSQEKALSSGKYTSFKNILPSVNFSEVNSQSYLSGMIITGKKVTITGFVESPFVLSNISGAINGNSCKVTSKKRADNSGYDFTLVSDVLPSGISTVEIKGTVNKTDSFNLKGQVLLVREKDGSSIDDEEKLYWPGNFFEQNETGAYKLKTNQEFIGYGNFELPITVKLNAINSADLEKILVSVENKKIMLSFLKEGFYSDIGIVITDRDGLRYESTIGSFAVDNEVPELEIIKPENGLWVQNVVSLEASATDENQIEKVEYSIDEGQSWQALSIGNTGTYQTEISLSSAIDGLITIRVKATDMAGFTTEKEKVIHKDTVSPVTQVILPRPSDVINGETTIALKITDNGKVTNLVSHVGEAADLDLSSLVTERIGYKERLLNDKMSYEATDAAGNKTVLSEFPFTLDADSDLPVVEIHVPENNAIIQTDFELSGVIYDDDGECKIWYSLDDGEFIPMEEYGNSYVIHVPLSSLTDNEHYISVYAEDIHGVVGEQTAIPFRVSLEEPKGEVILPAISSTVKGVTLLSGVASDANGIKKVQISVDNGNTFNDAIGTDNWTYSFDTRLLQDGTHVVFLRVYDNYGIQGLYSSLINIDNTAPEIQLELPLDGSTTSEILFFSGQTTDNITLDNLYIDINGLGNVASSVPDEFKHRKIEVNEIITESINIGKLPDGFYNILLTGEDAAGNQRRVSRNIEKNAEWQQTVVDLMYPMNGEHLQGFFNIYGTVVSEDPVTQLFLYVDGLQIGETGISEAGYFKFTLTPELIREGEHSLTVQAVTNVGKTVSSNTHTIMYTPSGPWVTIDNFTMGDYAVDRPYLEGSCGYVYTERDLVIAKAKEVTKEEKKAVAEKEIQEVELSFDNGKTYTRVSKNGKWRYRIENEDMVEGYHFVIVRATMKNGEKAITRSIFQIDKTLPVIKLISPGAGGRYNQELAFAGLTSDDVALKQVTLSLRSGDKSSYEVPSFIQGLYFDAHFFGASLFDVGFGLTFFDDNVKLQAQIGQLTQSQYEMMTQTTEQLRYGGTVVGAKLLANIGYMPFRYFFGPNWEWLSATFALGANFSMFSETQSGKNQILSAVLGQVEFPRITIPDQKMFSTYSFYTEVQVWFIPTDVMSEVEIASIIPQISCGLRVNVF